MDYNQFTYYRANPFAKQGFIPTVALNNRTKASFPSQMPMGQEHLGKIGKKFYSNGKHGSIIKNQHLLQSPQRYPFENRIALDKNFERNLNTIDIEGASSGTLMTQGVRNRLKAREELLRRQKQAQGLNLNEYQPSQFTQQEKRRQVALDQYRRKLSVQEKPPQFTQRDHNYRQYNSQSSLSNHRYSSNTISHQNTQENQEKNQYSTKNSMYQSIQMVRPSHQSKKNNAKQQNLGPTVSESQIYRAGRNLLNH